MMEDVKNKAINALRSRSGNVSIVYAGKDENLSSYRYGDITLVDFVRRIDSESPYRLIESIPNNYVVVPKGGKIPVHLFVDRKSIINLFSPEYKPLLVSAFPEIREFIEDIYDQINLATCTSCAKSSKVSAFVQKIYQMDNTQRDMSALETVLGTQLVRVLQGKEPIDVLSPPDKASPVAETDTVLDVQPAVDRQVQKTDKIEGGVAQPEVYVSGDGAARKKPIRRDFSTYTTDAPRQSCVNCCMKHVGTAIVLLEEASNGYPVHRWIAVGELNEAANEIAADYPELAVEIRDVRHQVTEDSRKNSMVMILLSKLYDKFFSES
jgi:hypothetical protein